MDDGSIVILDATNQISKVNEWQAHEKKVTSLALFQNDLLASGSDFEILLWNASASISSKKLVKREINCRVQRGLDVTPDSVNALVFLGNGILVSGTSGHIYVWDLNLKSFILDAKIEVYALCVLKNGHVASGLADGLVKIWDTEKRELETERVKLLEDVQINKQKMKELEDSLLYRLTTTQVIIWKKNIFFLLILIKIKLRAR
jgi:WD40 repeat protein